MADSAACCLCGAEDTWRHALLNCTVSRSTWALSSEHIIDVLNRNEEPDPKKWLFFMQEALSHDEFTNFVVTLCALWGSRRKAIYEHIYQSPSSVQAFVNSYVNELNALQSIKSTQIVRSAPRRSGWIAPPGGLAKFNVDAAVGRGRGLGAVAAISRDSDGHFLGASAVVFRGISEPATLKCMAIREALALADDLNVANIQVASDAKVVVQDIQEKNPTEYGAIIHEIIEHTLSFQVCNISHEFRSSNIEAHKLAKHALSLPSGRHVWLGQPHGLSFVPVNIVTS